MLESVLNECPVKVRQRNLCPLGWLLGGESAAVFLHTPAGIKAGGFVKEKKKLFEFLASTVHVCEVSNKRSN